MWASNRYSDNSSVPDRPRQYGGIGVKFDIKNGELIVEAVDKNSPAEKAGLKPGDRIVDINSTPGSGNPEGSTIRIRKFILEQAVTEIIGEPGMPVAITVSSSKIGAGNYTVRVISMKRAVVHTMPSSLTKDEAVRAMIKSRSL
jgi:carboxyl-terminal processing protease